MVHSQALQPVRPFTWLEPFAITATARWSGGGLDLAFELRGPLEQLLIPTPAAQPQRRDELWQGTCFEAFLARPEQERYWEINLAPSGDWNLYALDGYRRGLRAEPGLSRLPIHVTRGTGSDALTLACRLPLDHLLPEDSPLELSATTVLEHSDHGCSYWAWRHSSTEPDFHQRCSFLPLQPE